MKGTARHSLTTPLKLRPRKVATESFQDSQEIHDSQVYFSTMDFGVSANLLSTSDSASNTYASKRSTIKVDVLVAMCCLRCLERYVREEAAIGYASQSATRYRVRIGPQLKQNFFVRFAKYALSCRRQTDRPSLSRNANNRLFSHGSTSKPS